MEMDGGTTARILELLRSIPGTIEVARLDESQRLKVVDLETRHERSLEVPVRNLGIQQLAHRDSCFALLKNAAFRPPKVPTVYLVEQGDAPGPPSPHTIVVDGTRYRVIGEEVVPGRDRYPDAAMRVDESFVIFPERRTGSAVPCAFILPPISFPELEAEASKLGIADILSISPSLASDAWIRVTFGFSPANEFATLVVGCNSAGEPRP